MRIVLFLVILFLFWNFFSYFDFDKVDYDYTYTKAVCNGNVCRDYLIKCFNKEIVNIAPISGFVIFPENWEDSRENKELKC